MLTGRCLFFKASEPQRLMSAAPDQRADGHWNLRPFKHRGQKSRFPTLTHI